MSGSLFSDLQARLMQEIWAEPKEDIPFFKRPFVVAAQILWVVVRDLLTGQASLRAMSLVYTTLLAIVPVLALMFAVLKAFGVDDQIETLMLEFLAPMGQQGVEITERTIAFVQQVNISVLGSVGLVFLIYTLISLIQKIRDAFNAVWQVSADGSLARQMASYVSVGLLGPLVLFLAIGVIATTASSFLMDTVGAFGPLRAAIEEASRLLPFIMTMSVFAFIYLVVPNTRVNISAALVGGAITGVMWVATGWAFATFVVTSANYAAIYSAFASVILGMIWLYVAWLIVLVGCSITYYFQNRAHLSPESGLMRLTLDQVKRTCLVLLTVIHRSFHTGDTSWTSKRLSRRLGIPPQTVELIADPMVHAGMVAWAGKEKRLVPTKPADMTQVKEVLEIIATHDHHGAAEDTTLGADPSVDALLHSLTEAESSVLKQTTIADLIEQDTPAT